FVVICLGCMNFQFGGRNETVHSTASDKPGQVQSGSASVAGHQEIDVYYPVPLVSPPNLVISESAWVQVVDQKPDHFRVKNNTPMSWDFKWMARGVPVPPPVSSPSKGEAASVTLVPVQQSFPPEPAPIPK